jgi:hypothetical protein
MTQLVSELYNALLKAGVDDDTARAAAKSVIAIEDKAHLATKADLAELKADLIKWNVVAMSVLTAIYAGIVTLLRFKP